MSLPLSRRRLLTATVASTASLGLLSACGSGTIESALKPQRFIAFGDSQADMGQTGSRYSINDGSVNTWLFQLVSAYGLTLTPSAQGGLAFGRVRARVAVKPDAAGDGNTPTVAEQITQALPTLALTSTDVVVVSAGLGDVVALAQQRLAGSLSDAQVLEQARTAGRALGEQVRRLTNAGALYVVVSGLYNLGLTPWAASVNLKSLLTEATTRFNEGLLVEVVDLGNQVLYVDAAYYINLILNNLSSYRLSNGSTAVCTSVDTSNALGLGAGQVNAALCNPNTLLSGADPAVYAFADPLHLSPVVQRLYGTYAYDRLRSRW